MKVSVWGPDADSNCQKELLESRMKFPTTAEQREASQYNIEERQVNTISQSISMKSEGFKVNINQRSQQHVRADTW
jgi:hypothetical protein